jgi:NitT/TauT family transport system substrate-binding protein
MPSRRATLMTAAAPAVTPVGAAAACGSPPRPRRPETHLTYLTGFGVYGRDAYAWVADAKGYFTAAGVAATVRPGAGGAANLAALRSGRADLAILDYSLALVLAGTGRLDGVRCVAAINPRTLVALMTLPGRGIARPTDLVGKHLAQSAGSAPRTLFPAYARLAGFDPARVDWREMAPAQLPSTLASGRADAIGQFVVGAPAIKAAAGGRNPIVLPYGDYLTDLYGNVLVTTTDLVRAEPGLVRRFTGALLRGLRYAVDHPDESGQILHRAVPATPAAVAAAELTLMRPYVGAQQPGAGLGRFDESRVARGIAVLQANGMYRDGFDPSQVVDFQSAA